MNRSAIFAFRVSKKERCVIVDLALRLQRSQSDAVRFVVLEAAKQLIENSARPIATLSIDQTKQEGSHVTA